MSRGIINPTIGASEYGANIAQWDWKPFSDAMDAAKTTYSMVQGNKEEKRKQAEEAREQEEFELEKILFPTKKKAAELSLMKLQSEINENNANAERLKGMYDSRSLTGGDYAAAMFKERFLEYYNSPIFAGGSARPVAPSNSSNSSNSSNPSSLNSTSNFLNW
jgi:hypothetical protein